MKTPIVGASYQASSINAAADRSINLYPEAITYGGKDSIFLRSCPGLREVCEIGNGPIRGMIRVGGWAYVVSGDSLYRVNRLYSAEALGGVDGSGPVSMAYNGIQIFIAAWPKGYIYSIADETVTEITDPDFPGAGTVGYIDGYFVFSPFSTQKLWVTAILDGTSIDALEYASAEGIPDNIKAIAVNHREVWAIGETSTEIWYDSGATDFPLTRQQGAFIESGCAASFSVGKLDNALFWLGADERGKGVVYRSNGYSVARVSTHAIESAINTYSKIDDAEAFTYQQDGHSFYVLTFPTAEKTWCYDASTNLWHERATLVNGELKRYRARCCISFHGDVVVGDWEDGRLYVLDNAYSEDGDNELKWVRRWRALPPGQNNLYRTIHSALAVDIEAGVGTITGQGENPVISLSWSDDGGHTWCNPKPREIGSIGEYGNRVIWHKLGSTGKLRDRVYELSGSDPVRIAIMGAELNVTRAQS